MPSWRWPCAIFSYNKGLPMTVRSIFYPILGERIWGWPGHIIDIMAVFATLFGLATSLGYGAQQATSGLNHLFGIGGGDTTLVLLITGITAVAIVSIVAGVDKGVKRLSELNMVLAFLLLMFVGIRGADAPHRHRLLRSNHRQLPGVSCPSCPTPSGGRTPTSARAGPPSYWGWWISWSPFVGHVHRPGQPRPVGAGVPRSAGRCSSPPPCPSSG
ncbi:MAG: BCCT family transporter [Gammaproteobacteria bacterium]|nr:BCCT family transporter [Gammaproteobacteria bacterium]